MTKKVHFESVLLCSSFTPPLNAGSGKNAYNFGKFLVDKGIKVTLLSLSRKGKSKHMENDEGLNIRRILYFNFNILTKIISLITILPSYFYHIAKNDIVLIYGGHLIAFEFIILFGKLLGKKVIFQSLLLSEDDLETIMKRKFFGKVRQIILSKITLYFSINQTFSSIWLRNINNQRKLFESVQGVDTRKFYQMPDLQKEDIRNKLGLPPEITIIISVGYLIERKGFRDIFSALGNLNIPFLYVVVGDYQVSKDHYMRNYNQEMQDLYKLGKEILGNQFILTGPKTNIHEYLNASDLFILNSEREGMSNAVLESMACGLPTIFRDIPGIENDVMDPDRNILITTGEPKDIVNQINKVILDNNLRKSIGEKAVSSIQHHGSFEVVWENLLKKLHTVNE